MYDTRLNEDQSKDIYSVGEFIELYNIHEKEADISGWRIETLQPYQTFSIPDGVVLAPKSALVIAYKPADANSQTPSNSGDYDNYKEDFCRLYGVGPDNLNILFQNSVVLPNTLTSLVLKDTNGQTRDSTLFADAFQESCLHAPNEGTISESKGCLADVYSVQRRRINFNINGCADYFILDWGGKVHAYNAKEITNNSIGVLTSGFYGCNIIPHGSGETMKSSNYIQEIIPRKAMNYVDTSHVLDDTTYIVKRTYCDAMYRPTLTFFYNQTPNLVNLVTLQEYDGYARPSKDWLPIATEIGYLNANTFKNNADQYYSNESRPFVEQCYSTTTWDNNVLQNEHVASRKAGADMGTHKVNFVSRGNDSCEVKLFGVTHDGLLECKGYYMDSMLRVSETIDEDNHTRRIYTNLQEQLVMEKLDSAATYYVYNDLNQLCYVLPPLAGTQLEVGVYNEENDVLKKYAYSYKYDERGNQIYKRMPGCEPVLMIYDKGNLLVLSQTGCQREKGNFWLVYKYDVLRRLVYTAEIDIREDTYEEYLQSFRGWHMRENFSTGTIIHPMSNTGYSRSFFHTNPTKLLTVNYYDNYDFLSLMSNSKQESMTFSSFADNETYANAKGLLTGTRTYYLDASGDYTETVYYYDYRGREIQRRSTNHLGGYDVLSTKYDFSNNITDTWSSQSTNNGLTTTEDYHYTYDHANRPLTTTYTFNNESPILLQSYHYDELGRVRSRHIHNRIDSVTFCYDIRNQITQIKSSNYEQKYYYNQTCPIGNGTAMPTYNGNISATTWTYGNKTNGHMYYYDKMDRLVSNYSILNGSLNAEYLCSERFSYDAHGNITNLMRWDNQDQMDNVHFTYHGNQLSRADDEYDLYSYSAKQYLNNNTLGDDFAYDANGNMIYDKDRGISAIRYNLLNLPDTIQFANGNQIVHRYDAAGNRLITNYYTRKVTTTVPLGNTLTGTNNTTNYNITRDALHNNIVYTANNNDAYGIEFVHNLEGYIRYYGPNEHYHFYYIKDLLGNIRETYVHPEAGYKECVQRMQYYPSGLPWAEAMTPSEQPYKYNGKEFVEMHGLDEYDSKARWYYPAICRTTTIDPLAEKYYSTSPYAWCGNNPVRFVDPDGKKIVVGTWYGRMFAKLGVQNFEAKVINQLAILKGLDLEINNMITSLEDSPTKFYIEYYTNKNNHYSPVDNTVGYDPDDYFRRNGEKRPPEAALAHELGHAADDKDGKIVKYNSHIANGEIGTPKEQAIEQEKRDRNEVNSIYYENIVREKEGYPQRGYNYSAGD